VDLPDLIAPIAATNDATDWPHVNLDGREMPNDGDLVDLLLEWVPDGATRNRILIENPCALYGFPSPKQVSVG
jgi:2-pyrone-4,6-dicarboxylate lactonase